MSGIGSVRFHSFYISGLIRPENRPQYQTLLGTGRFLFVQLTSCYVFSLGFLIFLNFFQSPMLSADQDGQKHNGPRLLVSTFSQRVFKRLRREY